MSEWSQVRQRGIQHDNIPRHSSSNETSSARHSKTTKPPISFFNLIGVFTFAICLMVSVVVIEKILPVDLKRSDEASNPGRFIAQRAMEDLVDLTSLGPRVSGSHECEVEAVNLLTSKIHKIMNESRDIHVIQLDVQKASGSFPLEFLDGLTSVYRNVQNVVVRIGSRINSPHSLLLNCHFDSVSDSPGASDDGAGCAVMLEILRVMSKSDKILRHNIIFLFNGAEENLMQASHGFITQHKWAPEVRAFINLEACGAGGREVLFQAGPNNPWIMEIYSQTVPYPYASSLAQEIFESGLIPGDTDFRIFRDFGHISGLDFAWSSNGYVYHTKFDHVNQIPLGTLQRTGDNILALALGISNGYQLSLSPSNEGQPVFFDILGAFVVRLPVGIAGFIGLLAISIMIANMYLNVAAAKKNTGVILYAGSLRKACIVLVSSWLATILCCVGLAALLTTLGRAMAWFARPFWLYTLYVTQTVCVPAICLLAATTKERANPRLWGWTLVQIYADALSLLWGSILILCLIMRIRSGFVALLWVLCPSLTGLIRHYFGARWNDWRRLFMYLIGMMLPFIQTFYLILGAIYMAIPIMGRSGTSFYPEPVVGALVGTLFLFVLGWVGPLVLGAESPWKLVNWLLGVILVSVGLIILTPWGFPYSGDVSRPAPQRFMVTHTQRTFLDITGNITAESSGFWIIDLDTNSPHSVDGYVPSMRGAIPMGERECQSLLFCGLPYPLPVRRLIPFTHWLPGPALNLPPPSAAIRLTARETLSPTMLRFHFNLTGPDHIGVMISPVLGASLKSWSLLAGSKPLANPPWNGRENYFIYFAAGSQHEIPWHFHLDIVHSFDRLPEQLLDINVVGQYLHGPHKANSILKSFVSNFPSWTAVNAWSASFTSYLF